MSYLSLQFKCMIFQIVIRILKQWFCYVGFCYIEDDETWAFIDMEFLFKCSNLYLTHSLSSLVRYKVEWEREIPYLQAYIY